MELTWLDIEEIAIALEEEHPEDDNINLRFTDLKRWVTELEHFSDDPEGCNERILEAIQMAWIDERG